MATKRTAKAEMRAAAAAGDVEMTGPDGKTILTSQKAFDLLYADREGYQLSGGAKASKSEAASE